MMEIEGLLDGGGYVLMIAQEVVRSSQVKLYTAMKGGGRYHEIFPMIMIDGWARRIDDGLCDEEVGRTVEKQGGKSSFEDEIDDRLSGSNDMKSHFYVKEYCFYFLMESLDES